MEEHELIHLQVVGIHMQIELVLNKIIWQNASLLEAAHPTLNPRKSNQIDLRDFPLFPYLEYYIFLIS